MSRYGIPYAMREYDKEQGVMVAVCPVCGKRIPYMKEHA